MLSHADALYGAAYQVLYERVDPDSCVTREDKIILDARLAVVALWARDQSAEIAEAYRRAIVDIAERSDKFVENNERAEQMRETRKSIPTPP